MSSKFFNNNAGNTLFDKLKGIASGMANFNRFLAVVGFFRSSGYFKLRKELGNVEEIKILVGINIDDIFRRHNKTMLMLESAEKAKVVYNSDKTLSMPVMRQRSRKVYCRCVRILWMADCK